jgi:prevent-host-death family protein
MADKTVSIGEVKRDLSELVNRVAYGGERIVLTSRGKPKAALISMEDLERLRGDQECDPVARWKAWVEESDRLNAEILERREGKPVDLDAALKEARKELEERDDRRIGR